MFFYLDGEKWKIMKSGKKDSNDNGTIKKKKKIHKKKEVKRRETKEARREKKREKEKFHDNIGEKENCVPIGSKYLETNFTEDMVNEIDSICKTLLL